VQRYGAEVVGGAEAACRELTRRLAPRAEVTVLTTCATDATTWGNRLPAGESVEDGVRVLRFPTVSTRHPGFERLSRELFSRSDPPREMQERWIRAQGPESPGLVEEIRRRSRDFDLWIFYTYLYYPTLLGLPLVASRALLHPALHDEPPARLPAVRAVLRSAAALSLQTPEEWEVLLRLAGWPPSVVRLVGMGVAEGAGDPDRFRARAGIGAEPYLLCMGRVERGKGTDDLARLFAGFKERHPGPLKLVLAGPVIDRPPAHPDLVVTGAVDEEEKWGALEGCMALLHPSPLESFGLVLLEAWTKAKPAVVNGRCAVTAGHVRRAQGGLSYRDRADFEACVELITGDRETASRLGADGRVYAERFSWDRVLARYESLLDQVAKR
jgi:glycosyltransferase involved in cell wall biosynthesis